MPKLDYFFLADVSFSRARRVAFHKLLNFYIKCSNAKTQRYQESKSKNENGVKCNEG